MFTYQVDKSLSLALPNPLIDSESMFNLIDESRKQLELWLPWVFAIQSIEDERAALVRRLEKFGLATSISLIIVYKGEQAGSISFNSFEKSDNSTEIGYWLGNKFVGKGIMHRALKAMCQLAFDEYQVNKIKVYAAIDNQRSNKVAQNAGFHLDGVLRENILLADGYHDENLWTLIKSELQEW
ncbi:GNAT family N-acetyltransferase [Liquorilactobacillus cacaonum]|uniref:Acetyltransferase n=1 Tax=Liquorilactobacillus cacaonum DSM 21116 TaxID=1423729 RepID=A0A0R2CFQ5_9LACO|nr:GNAT family protein [Liquorilactobacillus cacaonum]KRM90138.1 acetyltransferase [Liquorilactobacillus cacaonum DSM 21116]